VPFEGEREIRSNYSTSSKMTIDYKQIAFSQKFECIIYIYCNSIFMAFQPHHMSVNTVRCKFMHLPK